MAYKPVRPGFRRTEEDIERTIDQKLAESTKAIEIKLDERTRPFEDIAKSLHERDRREQTEKSERERQEQIDKLADERANKLANERSRQLTEQMEKSERERQEQIEKLADERANKLADERANKLADERANKLADERAKQLAEQMSVKLADEKAVKLADEKAVKLAEEMSAKLVEERAAKLADEKARKLAEGMSAKLADEKAVKLADEKAVKLAEDMSAKLVEERAAKLADVRFKQLTEEKAKQQQFVQVPIQQVQTPSMAPIQTSPTVQTHTAPTPDTSSKIAKMIEEIKRRKASTPIPVQTPIRPYEYSHNTVHTQIPIISPDQAVDDGVACPTCHEGHVHSVETDGVTYKCTGPDCGKEYVMVDKTADYKCVGCGSPIKRPEDEKIKMDSCPFCKGKKAVKFDWGKVWKVQKPVMSTKR